MGQQSGFRIAVAIGFSFGFALLAGCGVGLPAAPGTSNDAVITGQLHGGQQPVSGARVYLMQADTSGYGAKAVSKLNSAAIVANLAANGVGGGGDSVGTYVLTNGNGSFSISGGYICSTGSPVYLLALGGNPGLAAGTNNTALAMMASLGPCPSGAQFSTSLVINVDEVSTVAAVYALAGFLTGPLNLSIPGNDTLATTGLANAVANVPQLEDLGFGTALTATPLGSGLPPFRKINTLANILASCINSDGSLTTTAGSVTSATACGTLFSNATSDGTATGTRPADTLTAMLNIAHHPGLNLGSLFPLAGSLSPFQPSLAVQPNDFTLSIVYADPGFVSSPGVPALDASGNVFLPSPPIDEMTKWTPQGVHVRSFGFNPNRGMDMAAVDPAGFVWAATSSGGVVRRFPNDVSGHSDFPYNGTSNDDGHQLAIDANGFVYISDYTTQTIAKLNGSGVVQTFDSANNKQVSVAIENTGQILTNLQPGGNALAVISSGGAPFALCGFNCPVTAITSEASDANDTAWYINSNSTLAGLVPGTGGQFTPLPGAPFSGGGLSVSSSALWVAIDGGGNVWIPNYVGQSISEFSNAGAAITPGTGYQNAQTTCTAQGLAIDGSGDVWVTCNSASAPVVEFIGAAVPVYTPLTPGHMGVRP